MGLPEPRGLGLKVAARACTSVGVAVRPSSALSADTPVFTPEEESLVAVLVVVGRITGPPIVNPNWFCFRGVGVSGEEVARVELVVTQVLVGAAVERGGATAGDGVDDGAAGRAVARAVVGGLHLHFLERIDHRNVRVRLRRCQLSIQGAIHEPARRLLLFRPLMETGESGALRPAPESSSMPE